jgi:putative transposase
MRGRKVRTTVPDPAAACPLDKVNRQFKADHPNRLGVADFTSVATWNGLDNERLRRRRFCQAHRGLAGVALGPSRLRARCPGAGPAPAPPLRQQRARLPLGLGSQYVSIRYTERLAEAGIKPSVGSVSDSYDCEIVGAARWI